MPGATTAGLVVFDCEMPIKIHNATHRAEQADERRGRPDGR
jgi:hypothetical protein